MQKPKKKVQNREREMGGGGEKNPQRVFVPVYNQESDSSSPQECPATSFSTEAYARWIVIGMKGEGNENWVFKEIWTPPLPKKIKSMS